MADTLDWLTLEEGYRAVNDERSADAVNGGGTGSRDTEMAQWITAVSRRGDELVGPVVTRTITDETHDGGESWISPKHTPLSSVTTLVEYNNTTATTLTAETNSTKPTSGYLLDKEDPHFCVIWRRSSNSDSAFPSGRRNVVLTYEAGRVANTAAVDEQFKEAAAAAMRRIFRREGAAWAQGGDAFVVNESGRSAGFFRIIDPVIRELLADDLDDIGVRAV